MEHELAIHGGKPAVTIDSSEQWKRPVEREWKLVRGWSRPDLYPWLVAGCPRSLRTSSESS